MQTHTSVASYEALSCALVEQHLELPLLRLVEQHRGPKTSLNTHKAVKWLVQKGREGPHIVEARIPSMAAPALVNPQGEWWAMLWLHVEERTTVLDTAKRLDGGAAGLRLHAERGSLLAHLLYLGWVCGHKGGSRRRFHTMES
eukprot:NODE_1259_length_573_cov_50.375954_g1184_i0.p1 GENE.NODE_1259_length_573_cov_50.375954_g1184_i0~~NODE_1259_length_573_cov_50.375954_g1184_i0.p1  ORF type:complete len:161 (+),score=24.51 NODE_1259_length_573_cov_50.375954_g1184_i0:57-485(+)